MQKHIYPAPDTYKQTAKPASLSISGSSTVHRYRKEYSRVTYGEHIKISKRFCYMEGEHLREGLATCSDNSGLKDELNVGDVVYMRELLERTFSLGKFITQLDS